jgi:ubiquinol-cytochrome c reductase cytochrome c subunit
VRRRPAALVLAALLWLAAAPAAGGATDATGTATTTGKALFGESCSSCHGDDGAGIRGRGPSLEDSAGWRADFYLRTGRMPLDDPHDQPRRGEPGFDRPQIRALSQYVASLGRPSPVPRATPAAGSLSDGMRLFTLHCSGCHQVVAEGGAVTGARVPDLHSASARDVAQAVRIGPYLMPAFNERQISRRDLDSIARYVLYTRDPDDAGGWALGHLGPIPEGIVTWFIGMALLILATRLIGERTSR